MRGQGVDLFARGNGEPVQRRGDDLCKVAGQSDRGDDAATTATTIGSKAKRVELRRGRDTGSRVDEGEGVEESRRGRASVELGQVVDFFNFSTNETSRPRRRGECGLIWGVSKYHREALPRLLIHQALPWPEAQNVFWGRKMCETRK